LSRCRRWPLWAGALWAKIGFCPVTAPFCGSFWRFLGNFWQVSAGGWQAGWTGGAAGAMVCVEGFLQG